MDCQHAQSADWTIAAILLQFDRPPIGRSGWPRRARQLDGSALDGQVAPLADLLAVPGASEVVESLRRIENYMAVKRYTTAMEEAFSPCRNRRPICPSTFAWPKS